MEAQNTDMNSRTLIPAHNGVHAPKQQSITFHNNSNLIQTDLHPSLYSMVKNTSGKVTLTEYKDQQEYTSHRDQVFEAIAKYHAHFGKQEGCECSTCR